MMLRTGGFNVEQISFKKLNETVFGFSFVILIVGCVILQFFVQKYKCILCLLTAVFVEFHIIVTLFKVMFYKNSFIQSLHS